MMRIITVLVGILTCIALAGNVQAASIWEDFEGVTPPDLPTGSWTFSDSGELTITTVSGGPSGNYLYMEGTDLNADWYLGGWGNWKPLNWYGLSDFVVNILGDGSWGTLKFELYEVDGDIFGGGDYGSPTYTPISWTGWQQVILPLADFTDRNPGVGDGVWTGDLKQINVIAAVGGQAGNSLTVGVDDISAIPEPSSLILLGTGLSGLLTMVRKRKLA